MGILPHWPWQRDARILRILHKSGLSPDEAEAIIGEAAEQKRRAEKEVEHDAPIDANQLELPLYDGNDASDP